MLTSKQIGAGLWRGLRTVVLRLIGFTAFVLIGTARIIWRILQAIERWLGKVIWFVLIEFLPRFLSAGAVVYPLTAATFVFSVAIVGSWWWTGALPNIISREPVQRVAEYFNVPAMVQPTPTEEPPPEIETAPLPQPIPNTQVAEPSLSAQPAQVSQPEPVSEVLDVDEETLDCAVWGALDDMGAADEQLAAAVTILNVAKDKATRTSREVNGKKVSVVRPDTCDVFRTYETLAAPGQTFFATRSIDGLLNGVQGALKKFGGYSEEKLEAAHADLVLMLRDYLANPRKYLEGRPWLLEPRRYIRTGWKLSLWPRPDESGIRAGMCRLSGKPGETPEFFRPKKAPDEVCPQ